MRLNIRRQLLVPVVAVIAGVAVASGWVVLDSARQGAMAQLADQLNGIVSAIREARYPLTANVLDQLHRLSGASFVFQGDDGQRLSTAPEFENVAASIAPREGSSAVHLSREISIGARGYLSATVVIDRPGQSGRLSIFVPAQQVKATTWKSAFPSLAILAASVLAALCLALWFASRMSRRINLLREQARRIAGGDLEPMPVTRPKDELTDLAASINEMAGQLAQWKRNVAADERLRLLGQVSGGLAHELRNRLAGLRLSLEVMADENGQAGERDPGWEVALRQARVVEDRLRGFLELGAAPLETQEEGPLDRLFEDAADLARPRCRHLGVRLSIAKPDERVMIPSPRRVTAAVGNLVDNAIDAAGPGGDVRLAVDLEGRDGRVRILVSDSGPGPSPDISKRLFEPFATDKPNGVGLGLAIARQTCERIGGTLAWRRSDGRTTFILESPCRAGSASP